MLQPVYAIGNASLVMFKHIVIVTKQTSLHIHTLLVVAEGAERQGCCTLSRPVRSDHQ
jgi:hypothetical protein